MTEIFVFGSNLAGRHGRGSALFAKNRYGAEYGVGVGRTGMAYAIPTKDEHLKILPLSTIKIHVDKFIQYAYDHPNITFKIVKIGCGLAGYHENDIKPLFKNVSKNCDLPEGWRN